MGLEARRQAPFLSLLYSAQAVGKDSEVPSSLLSFSGKPASLHTSSVAPLAHTVLVEGFKWNRR